MTIEDTCRNFDSELDPIRCGWEFDRWQLVADIRAAVLDLCLAVLEDSTRGRLGECLGCDALRGEDHTIGCWVFEKARTITARLSPEGQGKLNKEATGGKEDLP